ncbi:hypothetical protein MN116_001660 [Schistosoma mekongi]|uniref:SANT domain-containing protein n=1 Tax=Schistosoma mekongi TaxID=38744 RepID=A0AAE1ZIK6_SCHME|nr:hypothetical protein MN116_001660 [Schistosoma mekongi]
MGEFCSKPESGNPQSHPSVPSSNPQHARSRETSVSNASTATASFLSNMCDTISRLQSENHLPSNSLPPGSRIASSPEQIYTSSINRSGRTDGFSGGGPIHSSGSHTGVLTPEDMLAAAQICSHLSQSQLNALAVAYHQQQQQIHRAVGSAVSGTTTLGHVPGITFAQALSAVTSVSKSSSPTIPLSVHSTQQSPRQPVHSAQTAMHQNNQKRPPSGHSQFYSGHSIQMGSNASSSRPPSASQAVLHHRGNHPGPPGFGTMSSHVTPSQPITSHLDHNLHNAHQQTRASPSLSPSPGSNIYQNRRPQLAPPSTHPNKRPRISIGSQLPHAISSLPSGHVTNTIPPAGMEAILGSVVANKAMASLATGSNFLNPNAYSAATEVAAAAAAALTPFYTSVNNGSVSNPSLVATPNQAVFQPHVQHHCSAGSNLTSGTHLFNHHILPSSSSSYPGSLMGPLPGSLLSSYSNRSSFAHTTVSTQAITSGQALGSAPGLGSQPVTSQPPLSHLPAKASHSTSVSQIPSRLISGHLHHPHPSTHPSQSSFHHSNHPLPQPSSQHHMMGHSNLPQGSGVLRQQTKEPAYHPQVEAISPAPDESRLGDAQDAKLHREREEINRQLTVLDADINKQESHLRNLCEREARLTARLAAAPARDISNNNLNNDTESKSEKGDLVISDASFNSKTNFERNYENPIQAIISDNRQRTRQRHLIFAKLCGPKVRPGPHSLPFYRQPSDLSSVRAIQSNFRNHFRSKLVIYLQRRLRAEQSRINFLAQQYGRNSRIFTKKMDKLLSTTKRRQRDLRHRDIFEKALPEVKKNREDREMGNTEYSKSGMDEDSGGVSNLADGSQTTPYDAIEEMNKLKEYAIDPPVMLAPWQRRYQFICESGLITDCRAQLQENQDLSKWSEEEKQIFKERFLATPKNFTSIATHLERKSVADCIHYYYLSKKKEGYKQLLKKHNARRRRAAQTERGGGSTGGSASNSNAGGSSSSHGGNSSNNSNINSIPPSSGNCQNGHTNINSPRGERNEPDEKDSGALRSSSHADPSGYSESNEAAEHKDGDGYRNTKKDALHGGSTGARNRPGRGRPSQNSNHSNVDSHNTGSHGRNRSSNNFSRNTIEPHSMQVSADVKVPERDSLLSTIDKDSQFKDKVIVSPNTHSECAESLTDPSKLAQSQIHSGMVSNSSTRIKDLIHFAIEKNLTKLPSNDNQVNTTETLSSRITLLSPSSSQSSTNMTNFKHYTNPSTSVSSVISSSPVSSHMVTDSLDTSSPTVFPSTTAAEIYAAAARFAAASADICGVDTDPSTISVPVTADSYGIHKRDANKSSLPTTSLSSYPHSKPEMPDFVSGADTKRWMTSSIPPYGPLSLCHQTPDSNRPIDPSASSKAILLGDFLTAQQLGRSDASSNWVNNHSNSRQADYNTGSYQPSRCIDPSTLPVPVGLLPATYGNLDRHPESIVSEKGLGSDFFAEHAIRLAMHAKVAAAAAATSLSVSQFDGRGSSSVTENNCNCPERCVYSPLSPSPIKADGSLPPANHSTSPCQSNVLFGVPGSKNDSNYQTSSSYTRPLDNSPNSMHFKQDNDHNRPINSCQVASFIAKANKLYLEEVGSYASCDRPDFMRTLSSSEPSQLYGVLQQLRQQKEESGSIHLPSTFNVSSTNINIPNLNSRDQQSEYVGMCQGRPHSPEGTGDHVVGSYSESNLSKATQSRCMPSKGQNDRIQTSVESGQFVSDSVNSLKCSLPEYTVEESKGLNYRLDHGNADDLDPLGSSNTGKRSSTLVGLTTLESHINKAITEEIRAQTISRNPLVPPNICSPHLSRTPSPVGKHYSTRNSDSQFNLSVPLKKQDRSITRSPGMVNCSMISGSRDFFNSCASKISVPELHSTKLINNNQDILNKVNQKECDQKRKLPESIKNTSLSITIDSKVDQSCSPTSDDQSPGLLQIDLAASEFSPKDTMNSHPKDVSNFLACTNIDNNCTHSVKDCGHDDSSALWSHTFKNENSTGCSHNSTGLSDTCNVDSSSSAALKSL